MPFLRAKLIVTATLLVALFRPCGAADLKIDEILFATSISETQQIAVRAFYQFWNTGDALAKLHGLDFATRSPTGTSRTCVRFAPVP